MKTVQRHAVRVNGELAGFKLAYTEPMHHTVTIDAEPMNACIAEIGDRVTMLRWEGAVQDDEGISTGGKFLSRSGTVIEVFAENLDMAVIDIDNYGTICTSIYYGIGGYPNYDMQPENGSCGYKPKE